MEIWFEPSHKDEAGWRGPAKIATLQHEEGNATVRYQGRSLDRQFPEIRPYVPYVIFLTSQHKQPHLQWTIVRDEAELLPRKGQKIYGLVLNMAPAHYGWYLSKESKTKQGQKVLEAALYIASTTVHLQTCTTVRMVRGVQTLAPLKGFMAVETWFWKSTLQGGDEDDSPRVHETTEGIATALNIKRVISEEWDVREGRTE